MSFIHLRVNSAYSLAQGAIKIKEFPKLCTAHKMPAVAITDAHNLFGALEFSMTLADQGIQPIIGCTLALKVIPETPVFPMVVLAKDQIGYENLLKLVTQSHLHTDAPHFVTPFELCDRSKGLIALSGGDIGFLGYCFRQNDVSKVQPFIHQLKEAFSDECLFIELMRHDIPEQREMEPYFLDLALKNNLPLVATNNVYFSTPSLYEAHDALLCIEEGRYVVEVDRRRVTPNHYFKTQEEMFSLFKDLPEATSNTLWIAKRCHFRPLPQSPVLPRFPIPDGMSEDDELQKKAQEGLLQRLQSDIILDPTFSSNKDFQDHYKERLSYELDVIKGMGFSGYFLIVSDFIQWAKEQNIPVGPGRGSGAGSLVAYCLTITDLDPIRFQLIFERFLNPERVSMPDFDIDFCQDRRDEVIRYVQGRYGADHVAHIITFGKLQARAVLRDVGRVLQMPYGQVDRICKLIPNNPSNPVTILQAIEQEPLLQNMRQEDETVDRLINMATKLEGLYRHASTHAAGVVISNKPLVTYVPLYKDPNSLLPATQFNMKYVELAGLVKFDFLGLKTLTVIEEACKLVRKTHNPSFLIKNIPLDDEKTFDLLTHVRTVGVFQLESAGMKDVLKKLKPDRFEDIIALVSLYRPGPIDDIPRYLACKHGLEDVTYLHPLLQDILEPTYGVMVYQEQVMLIARKLGDYSLGEADLLRRAMGKKIASEMQNQRERFLRGATEKGITPEIASQIFEQMAKFSGYGFNKSHAAPYAMLAYQTAYLKANFPLEFFAATMTLDMHNIDKINAYRQDMESMGIDLLPPDINHSYPVFAVEGGGIRYGLAAIKNVGFQSTQLLIEERESKGAYRDFEDVIQRAQDLSLTLNKRQMEFLVCSGAFDSLCSNRRHLYESLDSLLSKKLNVLQGSLFALPPRKKTPTQADWPLLERLSKEFEALGFYLSEHPLSMYKNEMSRLKVVDGAKLMDHETGTVYLCATLLGKKEKASKSGAKFAFTTFSDLTCNFEVTFFGDVYAKYKEMLVVGDSFFITAFLRREEETIRLSAQHMESLDKKFENADWTCPIKENADPKELIRILQSIEPGEACLTLCFKIKNKQVKIILGKRMRLCKGERSRLSSL